MTKSNKTQNDTLDIMIAYSPFLIIAIGVFGNTCSLLIFQLNKDLKKMSSMVV